MLKKSRLVRVASFSLNLGPVLGPIALNVPILKLRISFTLFESVKYMFRVVRGYKLLFLPCFPFFVDFLPFPNKEGPILFLQDYAFVKVINYNPNWLRNICKRNNLRKLVYGKPISAIVSI